MSNSVLPLHQPSSSPSRSPRSSPRRRSSSSSCLSSPLMGIIMLTFVFLGVDYVLNPYNDNTINIANMNNETPDAPGRPLHHKLFAVDGLLAPTLYDDDFVADDNLKKNTVPSIGGVVSYVFKTIAGEDQLTLEKSSEDYEDDLIDTMSEK